MNLRIINQSIKLKSTKIQSPWDQSHCLIRPKHEHCYPRSRRPMPFRSATLRLRWHGSRGHLDGLGVLSSWRPSSGCYYRHCHRARSDRSAKERTMWNHCYPFRCIGWLVGQNECQRDGRTYPHFRWQRHSHLDGTNWRRGKWFLNCNFFNWLVLLLTQTLFTSAVWPKKVCFGDCSRTSQSLQVLSTDPVT